MAARNTTISFHKIQKFGRNAAVAQAYVPLVDINAAANVFQTTAGVITAVSTSDADNGGTDTGARAVGVQGVNAAGEYVIGFAPLNGQTPVTLMNPHTAAPLECQYVLRGSVGSAGSSQVNEGRIDFIHDAGPIIGALAIGEAQSEIAMWYFNDSGKGGCLQKLDLGIETGGTKIVTANLVVLRNGVFRWQVHNVLATDQPNLAIDFDGTPIHFRPGDLAFVEAKVSSSTIACYARMSIIMS